jgi:aerobic-type carbon monoxide dehydrogenase small subunit (CoxS/CutS family)
MKEINIHFTVNDQPRNVHTNPDRTLLAVLREDLGLTSVKEGCGQGDCGSCIVVMNGMAVNSCLVLAGQVEGAEIITLEGLESENELHPLQHYFAEKWAFQCGYCTPGMIMSCYALLIHNPIPAPDDIRKAIEGNLCRCTNYSGVVDAVMAAAEELRSLLKNRVIVDE